MKPTHQPSQNQTLSSPKTSRIPNLKRRLAVWYRRLVKLSDLLSEAELQMDSLRWELGELLPLLKHSPSGLVSPSKSQPLPPPLNYEEQNVLQQQAEQGAISLSLESTACGSISVRIDGRRPVPLTPQLAKLLTVLVKDDKSPGHLLVPWKSVSDISAAMHKLTGRRPSKHALAQLISRLKDRLRRYRENDFLLQSNAQLGYRFALRRPTSSVIPRDHR